MKNLDHEKDLITGSVNGHEVLIPQNAVDASKELALNLANTLGFDEIESSLFSYWTLSIREAQWQNVLGLTPYDVSHNLKYLEIGCGLGLFVVVGKLLGLNCMGVEPGEEKYQGSVKIAHQVLQANGLPDYLIKRGHGEKMEFPDESFDVICSFQTIEHVADPFQMLCEIKRILKPGGVLFLQCPNYHYPYEGHYGLFLPCPLGKIITKLALRLYKRPVQFLEHLNWITPGKLHKWLYSAGFMDITVSSKLTNNDGPKLAIDAYSIPYKFTRGASSLLHNFNSFMRLPIVNYIAKIYKMYPQIMCVARKSL